MQFANDEEKRRYFRQLGSKGGKTTVRRYGREHMSRIGRKGFEVTASYFHSEQAYKQWIASLGGWAYWKSTGLLPKLDRDGNPCFPTEKPVGPWDDDYVEF